MITIRKEIELRRGIPPYQFKWISQDNCVTSFSNPEGETDSIVETDIVFLSSECIADSVVKLFVKDAEGCKGIFDISVEDPCTQFSILELSNILEDGNLQLSVVASESSTITWNYDNRIFTEVTSSDDSITLSVGNPIPDISSSTIYVTATNSQGCIAEAEYTYTFCNPVASNAQVSMCKTDGQSSSSPVCLQVQPCQTEIDWSTLSISFDNTSFSFTNEDNCVIVLAGPVIDGMAAISASSTIMVQGLFTVSDTFGNTSNEGIIFVEYKDCSPNESCVFAPSEMIRLTCEDVANLGLVDLIDLDDYVDTTDCEILWETFEFIAMSSQTTTGVGESATLTTPYGEVNFDSDHKLIYNFTTTPSGTETIQWQVTASNGDKTGLIELVIIHECVDAPVATDDAFCISCEAPYNYLDVLANDTGDIDPTSVMIVTYPDPTEGTVSVNNQTGGIMFVPNPSFEGTSTFTYRVANYSGVYSNISTVMVTVACAGVDSTVQLCN